MAPGGSGWGGVVLLRCWSLPETSKSQCTTTTAACGFSYTEASTPTLSSVTPARAAPGTSLTLGGARLPTAGAGVVLSRTAAAGGAADDATRYPCEVTAAAADAVTCTVDPSIPAGVYAPALVVAAGGRAISLVTVTVPVHVAALAPRVVSMAGGTLQLTSTGSPAWNATHLHRNVITLAGGLPCKVGSPGRSPPSLGRGRSLRLRTHSPIAVAHTAAGGGRRGAHLRGGQRHRQRARRVLPRT